MNTRVCYKCGQEKPLDCFHRNKSRPLGRSAECKECRASYDRSERRCEYDRTRAKTPERVARSKAWIQSERGKAIRKQRIKEDYARNKAKYTAKILIEKLVGMGVIKKLPCVKCGNGKSLGHHPNYSEPLEVVWLCQKHHSEEHRILKKVNSISLGESPIAPRQVLGKSKEAKEMRQEQDYCKRCGNPIEAGMIGKSDICGNCADDLRLDGEAETVFTLSNPYLKQTSLE